MPASNIISISSALTLGGGVLNVIGASAATNSQAFNGTTFTANTASAMAFTQGVATSLSASLGALTVGGSSTVDFSVPSSGTVSTNSATFAANGLLVSAAANGIAFATANGQTAWATNNAGVLGG